MKKLLLILISLFVVVSTYSQTKYLLFKQQYPLQVNNNSNIPNWIFWYNSMIKPVLNTTVFTNTTPDGWYEINIQSKKKNSFDIFSNNIQHTKVYCKKINTTIYEKITITGIFNSDIKTDTLIKRKETNIYPAKMWTLNIYLRKNNQQDITKRIGVVEIPENKYLIEKNWDQYKYTVQQIEYLTGCTLISQFYEVNTSNIVLMSDSK
jgi:hypothetical protein